MQKKGTVQCASSKGHPKPLRSGDGEVGGKEHASGWGEPLKICRTSKMEFLVDSNVLLLLNWIIGYQAVTFYARQFSSNSIQSAPV